MAGHDEMIANTRKLRLRVNDELVLNAGTCEQVERPDGKELCILPSETTLFHQVLTYLQNKPDPPREHADSRTGREGVAAAAVTLRWGSYLAVLLDPEKPLGPKAKTPGTSRIHDTEMARINIEASAALAEWIDLARTDRRLYDQLVKRAASYLPLPRPFLQDLDGDFRLRMKHEIEPFLALGIPGKALELMSGNNPAAIAEVLAKAREHPSRVFANTFLNIAWRNGPVENLHSGKSRGYPLDTRRITPEEEKDLMAFSSERLGVGMHLAEQLANQQTRLSWPEQVLPFALARFAPSRWTLTEHSREVRLPG
jgi:hypothetical protein